MTPYVSIIILSWNTKKFLLGCLHSLAERVYDEDYEVVVVDNASQDGSCELVAKQFPSVRLIGLSKNIGYAAGTNIGIRMAKGKYILLLNSDIIIVGNAIETMASFLEANQSYGAVAPQLLNPDGSVQKMCRRFPTLATLFLYDDIFLKKYFRQFSHVRHYLMRDFDHLHSCDVEQPPSSCIMITADVINTIGLFDEQFFLFFPDVDFCIRLKRHQYLIRYLVEAKAIHHLARSVAIYPSVAYAYYTGRYWYFRKWYGRTGGILAKIAMTVAAGLTGCKIIFRKFFVSARSSQTTESTWTGVVEPVRRVWKNVAQG